MRRKLAMTAALVVALAVAGYAQKPDFSGVWTPEPAADAAAGGGRGPGGPMTVKQTATELSVETQGRNGPQTRTYKLDGSESDSDGQVGRQQARHHHQDGQRRPDADVVAGGRQSQGRPHRRTRSVLDDLQEDDVGIVTPEIGKRAGASRPGPFSCKLQSLDP